MTKVIEEKVKKIISDHIGTEPEDIDMDDNLRQDLDINAAGIAEIVESFDQNGLPAKKIDIDQVETVSDLVESLKLEEDL